MRNMKRVFRFWKIILLDSLGVALMILAILASPLPGPGGIPLFIVGLSVLGINHDWAKRYIDNIQDYVKKLTDKVFNDDPYTQIGHDITSPLMVLGGAFLLWRHSAPWLISLGIFMFFTGCATFLANRNRWKRFKQYLKRKK